MATIDERELLPSVMPSTQVPDPAIRLQVSPASFGGYQAQGVQHFGEGVAKAGADWQAVQADDVANQLETRIEDLLHNPDTGYMTLEGADAVSRYKEYQQKFNNLFQEAQGKLGSFDQRRNFDNLTRRYRAVTMSQMGTHADTQGKKYGENVYGDTAKLAAGRIVRNPNDDNLFQHSMADMVYGAKEAARIRGAKEGDPQMTYAEENAISLAWQARIHTIGAQEDGGAKAMAMADAHKKELGAAYPHIYEKYHTQAEDEGTQNEGKALLEKYNLGGGGGGGVGGGAGGPVVPSGPKVPNLDKVMDSVLEDARKVVDVPVSSGRRTEEQQKVIPGAARQGSHHTTGKAIDIPLAGMPEEQQKKIVTQFLNDPRITGFEFLPGHHMHVDVGHTGHAVFGGEGRGWPQWLKDQVRQWQGQKTPVDVPQANLAAATDALKLTPQEQNLYNHHLHELSMGGVVNRDRTVSTVQQLPLEHNGRWYNVPSVWDQQLLWDDEGKPDEAEIRKRVEAVGWDKFPAYATPEEADARYEQMHVFMDKDARTVQEAPQQQTAEQKAGDVARSREAAIRDVMNGPGSLKKKGQLIHMINEAATAKQLTWAADEKDKRDANDKAANGYMSVLTDPTAKVDPSIVSQIARDPNLNWQTKDRLNTIASHKTGLDIKQEYGPGFWEAYKAITLLPPGDPKRITDVEQLLKMAAGPGSGLTLAGMGELGKVLHEVKQSKQSREVMETKAEMQKYAYYKLVYPEGGALPEGGTAGVPEGMGDMMPGKAMMSRKGLEVWQTQFYGRFNAEFEEWIKAGKNPYEFLKRENVDKMLEGMFPRKERLNDALRSNEAMPPAPSGYNRDSWGVFMTHPPSWQDGQVWRKSKWAGALQYLVDHKDEPGVKEKFTGEFQKFGYDADSVLRSLGKEDTGPAVGGGNVPYQTQAPSGGRVPYQTQVPSAATVPPRPTPSRQGGYSPGESAPPVSPVLRLPMHEDPVTHRLVRDEPPRPATPEPDTR